MRKAEKLSLGVFLLASFASTLMAQTGDANAWLSVRQLKPGRPVEVVDRKGVKIKGALANVADDSISVTAKKRTSVIARSEVVQVKVRSGRHRMYTLIGLAIGAGAGVGLGAAGGQSLADASGGDFANLKAPITAGGGAIGGLIGALIGSAAGNHVTTVYRAP